MFFPKCLINMKDEKFLSVIFIEYGEKIMKTCVVEVSMDQQQNSELGNRWKDGKTKVFLKPVYAHFGGKWSSIRPNDITEYGSDNTAYVWKKEKPLSYLSEEVRNIPFST